MNNFEHVETMKVFSFSKSTKFYEAVENGIKLPKNVDRPEGNFLSTCCGSFCPL